MKQTRQDMADILCELFKIQAWALEHSIYTFNLQFRCYPLDDEGEGPEGLIREYGDTEERFLDVTIFKTGDDTDSDYKRFTIRQSDGVGIVLGTIQDIKDFIGYV